MLPAVLAISVALLTRKIFLGLGIGVVAGALVAQGGDPGGSLAAIYRYLFSAVFDQSHAAIVIFSFLVAATANILTDSGAVTALIFRMGNLSRRRRSLMGTSWLAGLVVFFDDYANCLIVGSPLPQFTIAAVFLVRNWPTSSIPPPLPSPRLQ